MQVLEYCGFKPFITPKGITFSTSMDRFTHINELIALVRALKQDTLHKTINLKEFLPKDSKEALEFSLGIISKKELYKRESEYKVHLYNEVAKVKKLNIDKYDKISYIYNLEFMFDYRTQRKFNKIIYHLLIEKLTSIIFKNSIKKLELPLTGSIFHIMKSLKNELRKDYSSTDLIIDNDLIIMRLK